MYRIEVWKSLCSGNFKAMSKLSPLNWPVVRQMKRGDLFGRDKSTQSAKSENLHGRTVEADKVVQSVCPYCAVGCSQRVYVKDDRVVHIEGDSDSPISRGRLCPKGAASEQLVNSATRLTKVKYRAPHATEWQDLDLETAMDMIADRFIASRRNQWEDFDEKGRVLNRTMGVAGLGGATLDNEENYIIKKLFTAAGAVQVENQARI
jgi:Uncharacterized anaerobic dehydrogenase